VHGEEIRRGRGKIPPVAAFPSPKEPQPTRGFSMGPGDYSCAACGMGMTEPCEHWKEMLVRPESEVSQPPSPEPQAVDFTERQRAQQITEENEGEDDPTDFAYTIAERESQLLAALKELSSARALLREKDASLELVRGLCTDLRICLENREKDLAAAKQEAQRKDARIIAQDKEVTKVAADYVNLLKVHNDDQFSFSSLRHAVEEARNKLENIFCPHVPGERVSDLATVREAITMLEAILSRATRLEQKIAAQKEGKR
jgi:pyruvate/2-oxoglutarate dehydrogenase complex dihydrolipoamide acyltransferase (E2) component